MSTRNKKSQRARAPNKRKLTSLFVEKVVPGERRMLIWDTDVQGLVLRIEPSGAKSWYAYYRRNGRPRWYRLGNLNGLGLSDAREAVRRINAKRALDPAYDPQVEKRESRSQGTVAELVEQYIAEHLSRIKSGDQGSRLLRRFVVPGVGRLYAKDVIRSDIRKLLKSVDSTSVRQLTHANLSGMFNWAIRNDYLEVSVNPASGIVSKVNNARERVLSNKELPQFWTAFDDADLTAGRALKVILLTGQRPGEVRHMRWADVDIGEHRLTDDNGNAYMAKGGWWTLSGEPTDDGVWPGTKNAQSHRVWLSEFAVQIIEAIHEEQSAANPSPYVFQSKTGGPVIQLDGPMRAICQTLGIVKPDKITPHDLRRTHGTTITSLRFTRDAMNRIENHAEGGIGSVYDQHSYEHEAREIQEAVAARLMTLIEGKSADNVIAMGR